MIFAIYYVFLTVICRIVCANEQEKPALLCSRTSLSLKKQFPEHKMDIERKNIRPCPARPDAGGGSNTDDRRNKNG